MFRLIDKGSWMFSIPRVGSLDQNTEPLKERESTPYLRREGPSLSDGDPGGWEDKLKERTDLGWRELQGGACKLRENFKHQFKW